MVVGAGAGVLLGFMTGVLLERLADPDFPGLMVYGALFGGVAGAVVGVLAHGLSAVLVCAVTHVRPRTTVGALRRLTLPAPVIGAAATSIGLAVDDPRLHVPEQVGLCLVVTVLALVVAAWSAPWCLEPHTDARAHPTTAGPCPRSC